VLGVLIGMVWGGAIVAAFGILFILAFAKS
jgi:hypothetical protein